MLKKINSTAAFATRTSLTSTKRRPRTIGRQVGRWYANERYWVDSYPFVFPSYTWSNARIEIDFLLSQYHSVGKSCLDLCCGIGRHSAALARSGFDVTAADSSRFLIAQARKKTVGLGITFQRIDLEKSFPYRNFDLVINLGCSFGQFDTDRQNKQFLVNMASAVSKGGYLVINCLTREVVQRGFRRRGRYKMKGGYVTYRRTKAKDMSTVTGVWSFLRRGFMSRYHTAYRLYDLPWFVDILKENDFRDIYFYGGYEDQEYGERSKELIILAKRTM
uniref:SAM-dependent methyltransferase n=2 Tax=Polaromonas sp. W10N TaxID=1840301 RepID=A0A2S1FIH6_9BURK|nr:class I SAM-dependent methyltransferase [Polaromonas sp. W10N]AWD72322.1 SAM-dependent methyltransferase [Polaromonas sp. W10N]